MFSFFRNWYKIHYHKSNFEKVQLGLTPQWKWYSFSINFNDFNISFVNQFFYFSFQSLDFYIIPTIKFNILKPWNSWNNFSICFLWLNISLTLNVGNYFNFKNKGYKTKKEISEYKKTFLNV